MILFDIEFLFSFFTYFTMIFTLTIFYSLFDI